MTTPTVDGEVSPSKRGTVKLRVVLVGIGWVWISLFPAMWTYVRHSYLRKWSNVLREDDPCQTSSEHSPRQRDFTPRCKWLSHPSYLSPTNTKLPCRVHFVLHRSRRKLGFRTGVFDASHLLVITWKLKLGFDFLTWRPATSHFKSHKNWSRSEKNMAYKTGIVLKEQLIGRRWSTLYDRYRTSSIVSIIFQPHIDISPR